MPPAVVLHGLADLNRALARTERDIRLGWRRDQRQIAEPTRAGAAGFAPQRIRNLSASSPWGRMRTGVTRKVVYVAPRQKGARGRGPTRRPNFADLLMQRAMEPALEAHRGQIERDIEKLLDQAADRFNRGGPL